MKKDPVLFAHFTQLAQSLTQLVEHPDRLQYETLVKIQTD